MRHIMQPCTNRCILENNTSDIQSTLKVCLEVCMLKILTKSRQQPKIGGHFGFMQSSTLSQNKAYETSNRCILENNTLKI